jgi:hypothetical protein
MHVYHALVWQTAHLACLLLTQAQRHAMMPNRSFMQNTVVVLAFVVMLSACASSSSIVVGTVHPAIQPAAVKLYLEPPKSYEKVALLESSSKASFTVTDQGKTNKMIERLKEEAAKLGANGVLLTGSGSQQVGGAVFIPFATGGGMMAPAGGEHKTGTGIAIYVTEE